MNTPDKFKMDSVHGSHHFIKNYGFATLVTADLNASQLPLFLAPNEGEFGALYGHIARSNPHKDSLDNAKVLAIFSGPHAYISPSWYATSPAVPTWNYARVHATGVAQLTDQKTTAAMLNKMVKQYDPSLITDNKIPEEFQVKLSQGIVGFKIVITQLDGKNKLGQHRPVGDQRGVAAALKQSENLDAQQLYRYMASISVGVDPSGE